MGIWKLNSKLEVDHVLTKEMNWTYKEKKAEK